MRLMKRKIKDYGNATFDKDALMKTYYLDEADNAVVRMKLTCPDDIFSAFSVQGYEVLSQEVADYLDRVIYYIPLRYAVILQFEVDGLTIQQEKKIKEVIANHYGLILADKKQDLRINAWTIAGLLIVGGALLAFSYYLASSGRGQLFTDFINIAGTFALWEAVDLYLLDRKVKKIEGLNAGQTATAKVRFKYVRNM